MQEEAPEEGQFTIDIDILYNKTTNPMIHIAAHSAQLKGGMDRLQEGRNLPDLELVLK